MLARALRMQQGQREFKNNPAAARRNRRLDCVVAFAFRLRSLSYGGQVAPCNDELLTSKTNRGLRQGS